MVAVAVGPESCGIECLRMIRCFKVSNQRQRLERAGTEWWGMLNFEE